MVTKDLQTLNLKFDQVMFNSLVLTWERNFEVTFGIFSVIVFQISVLESYLDIYLFKITHICRIKGCGGAGCPPPPPIIFERLKLPQQIIYRRKEDLSESPNHQKYWENILVSRFYEQFSRNRRNLGHFRKFEKISNS